MRLSAIADALGLGWEGDEGIEIAGLAGLQDAGPADLSFVEGPRYLRELQNSRAGVVLAPAGMEVGRACLRSLAPYADFARAVDLLMPLSAEPTGVHPTAVIEPGVVLGSGVAIGAYSVIGAGSRLGDRSRLHPHVTLYAGVSIGRDCVIHSGSQLRAGVQLGDRVVIQNGAVIGSEGFGFVVRPDGSRVRVPHRSGVSLADDVEIGANSTIDASHSGHPRHVASSSATRIGSGVKIDNLVQVAHGCTIGDHSVLCAQVGLAGSTSLGRYVFMLGQAAAKGHVRIGDRSMIGGATAVTSDVPPGSELLGVVPGMDRRRWARIIAAWKRLPELLVRVRRIEDALELRGDPGGGGDRGEP
jgi:UDP-3-O-[3-hydroxymyristoyl] glucosamine N-acyltransferase